jgi:tetratricopeptide (TPR) repeat protein
MGAVWLAEDPRLHRQVALKMVRPADSTDQTSRTRLMREARAAAALNHPHIAIVHDVLEDRGEVVIVFEYVEGETLHARIARGPLPPPEAVDVATQIANALAAAHAHGIVHRDLKPANVIVGAGRHVKVLDFGIARILAVGTTETAGSFAHTGGVGFVGTASYAAPEQMVSTAVDERADLYALGVVLFEMISGRRPFPGNDPVQLATSKLSQDAPPLSSTGQLVPPALDRLTSKLLERDPGDRPASATEALAELQAIYGTKRTGPPRLWPSLAAVAVIAALAGFGAWELGRFVRPPIERSAPPVIAVMPLANVSGDPAKDYVAAGIAESLISSLASLPSVTVLSRASVADARSRAKDEAALAKDLGATFVVNGSVQEANGMLKISLNLVRPDRTVAWGDSVEGTFDRIFELQSRLAEELTGALVVRVSASERERMNAQPTDNPDALAAYWQGKAFFDRRDVKGNLEAAASALSTAIALDRKFALAHAALGEVYWYQYSQSKDPSWVQKAMAEGMTALRLDPDRPEVRLALAATLSGTGEDEEAIDELKKALSLRPTYDDARRRLGQLLARRGEIDGAIDEFKIAIALRPNYWGNYADLGLALYNAARYQEAAKVLEQLVTLQPDSFIGFQQLGTVHQAMGDVEKALEYYHRSIAIRPSLGAFSNIGAIHHARGEFEQAIKAYEQGIAIRPNVAGTYRNVGDAYRSMGRAEEARAAYLAAVSRAEAELKINPSNARTLASLALYLAKAGTVADADRRIAEALALAPRDVQVVSRAAAVEALHGRTDAALRHLVEAVAAGYSRTELATDDDFASLRQDATFRKLTTNRGGQ